MAMKRAFARQGFEVAWRGDIPATSSEITAEYLAGTVEDMPRVNLPEGETLDGLDINQLRLDFEETVIERAIFNSIIQDRKLIRDVIEDVAIILTELVQWTLDNTAMTAEDFTPSVIQSYQDIKVIADRIK